MAISDMDDWFLAQNQLLAMCLLDPDKIPTVINELDADDFAGQYRLVYEAMRKLFRASRRNDEIDIAAIFAAMGETEENKRLLMKMCEDSPHLVHFDRYLDMAKDGSKLSKLRGAGRAITDAVTLEDAQASAEEINKILADKQSVKSFGPKEMVDSFRLRHQQKIERLPWPMDMHNDIPARQGSMIAICAEPSGGKTAFGLQLMWEISKTKKVVFISLETDEETLADCWSAFITGIGMNSLMDGTLNQQEWKLFNDAENSILERRFAIIPASNMTVSGIKAIALAHRADVVIVDYLQLIRDPATKGSRYETVTEVSMQLHGLAMSTGITVIPLCQVTNRDPATANKALTMHSARESGQIEQDCDVMVMIDKFIEKEMVEAGVRCNRIIRVVKNKRGRQFKFPAMFDGLHQTFTRVAIPNAELEEIRAAGRKRRKKQEKQPADEFEQLPMDTEVPF